MMTPHLIDDLDLGAVQLFLGAIELGSVSKAAARSGITQPSATARLQKLERQLGAGLLERSPTGSVPTEAGNVLAGACGDLLAAARHLAELAQNHLESSDRLRLATTRTTAELLLPSWLGLAQLDDVILDITELDTMAAATAVREGQAALGLCDGPFAPLGLRSEVVGSLEIAVVVGPGHRLAGRRRRSLRPGELANADLIMRAEGSGTRDVIEAALAPHGFDPNHPRFEVASNAAARLAAVNGSGVAMLPIDQVAADLDAGRLVRLTVRDLRLTQPVRLVWKGTQPATAAARRLRSALTRR